MIGSLAGRRANGKTSSERRAFSVGGLAERLVGLHITLVGEIALEGDGLFNMEFTKVSEFGISLKAVKSFRDFVERTFAIAFGFLEISEISVLEPFVFCIVFNADISCIS